MSEAEKLTEALAKNQAEALLRAVATFVGGLTDEQAEALLSGTAELTVVPMAEDDEHV
jgi:hypothetical protein